MDDSDTMIAPMGFVCYMNVVLVCYVFLGITCIHRRSSNPFVLNLATVRKNFRRCQVHFVYTTPMPLRVGYGDRPLQKSQCWR